MDELFTNTQSQTSSTESKSTLVVREILSRDGTISLSKIFENNINLVFFNADAGICDRNFNVDAIVLYFFELQGENNLSFVGEFDGVGEEVTDYLT
jgi:hypothetical protein